MLNDEEASVMPIKEIKNYVVAYYAGAKNLTGHA